MKAPLVLKEQLDSTDRSQDVTKLLGQLIGRASNYPVLSKHCSNILSGRIVRIQKHTDDLYPASKEQEEPQKPEFERTKAGLRVKRDQRIGKTRLKIAGYRCEINPDHKTFTSSVNVENYVEVHHLIPLTVPIQREFGDSRLDRMVYIFSLCPNCHRRVHHAVISEMEELLRELFKKR